MVCDSAFGTATAMRGGYLCASVTGKTGLMVREKYLKLHLGDESRSEDVGLDTYGI